MPNRSSPNFPHEHTRRRNRHDARRPANNSKQHANNSPSRAVVVAVPRSYAKYCLPSRKHCSGCIRWRYCPTTLASDSDVAKYRGSRCPRPQYSARFTVATPSER